MQPRRAHKGTRTAEELKRRTKNSNREERLRTVLREVQELLESYAPTWYTEPLSKKTKVALRFRGSGAMAKRSW